MVSEVKFTSRAKFLDNNLEQILKCYVQGTRETEANSLLTHISAGILRTAIDPNTREATKEVVSENEDHIAPFEALDDLEVSIFLKKVVC